MMLATTGGICEYYADKDMQPPVGMSDTFTIAQINDVKAYRCWNLSSVSKHGGIGIGTVELEIGKELSEREPWDFFSPEGER